MHDLRALIACSAAGLFALAGAAMMAFGSTTSQLFVLDDFNDNAIDPAIWSENEGGISTITEVNQRLEIYHPAASIGGFGADYWGECSISGDFSIQTDFDLVTWPAENGIRTALVVYPLFKLERTSFGPPDFPGQPREVYVSDLGAGLTTTLATETQGKLRIDRVGTTATTYFFRDGAWVEFTSRPGISTEDVYIDISSWGSEDSFVGQDVLAAYDNVMLQADATECPISTPTPTPTPSPTPTPAGEQLVWGDDNCSGSPDPIDSLLTLRFDAGLAANTGECPAMGQVVEVANASPHPWGDVDCSGAPNPIDSLKKLRFNASLPVVQPGGCPEVGATVLVSEPAS